MQEKALKIFPIQKSLLQDLREMGEFECVGTDGSYKACMTVKGQIKHGARNDEGRVDKERRGCGGRREALAVEGELHGILATRQRRQRRAEALDRTRQAIVRRGDLGALSAWANFTWFTLARAAQQLSLQH